MTLNTPASTITYVIINLIALIGLMVIVYGMFRNHLRKKTIGTLLLFISFLTLLVGPISSNIGNFIQAFSNVSQEKYYILNTISTITIMFFLQLIYIFSCRHIIRDNDLIKSITLMSISTIIGATFINYIFGIFGITDQTNPNTIYYISVSEKTGDIVNISQSYLSIMLTLIQTYIILRISIRSFILSRRTTKFVRKTGLNLIAWGLLLYIIGGFIIVLEIIPNYNSLAFPMIFFTLRKIIFFSSYIIMYLGFVMPEKFRRRIRGKSWFEKKYDATTSSKK